MNFNILMYNIYYCKSINSQNYFNVLPDWLNVPHIMRIIKYCKLDIIYHVNISLFTVSGPFCAAIISVFVLFFLIDSHAKQIFAVITFSLLKGDSKDSKNLIPLNNT